MGSPNPPRSESWRECRQFFERGLTHFPQFSIPLYVIDWVIAQGRSGDFYAWRSHDHLVVSNRQWNAQRADRLVVIPQPDAIELRLYHDSTLVQQSSIKPTYLDEALPQFLAGFGSE